MEDKPSLAGHFLCIRTSNDRINIITEPNGLFSQFLNRPLLVPEYLEESDFIYTTNGTYIPNSFIIATLRYETRAIEVLLEIDQLTATHLRIQIKNGSIAFLPHNMQRFKITYKFYW